MKFTAIYIESDINDVIANVLFADPESNPDEPCVLMFSRAVEFADSRYYFEVNDQSYGSYGGLDSVKIARDRIEVCLQPELVAQFDEADFARIEVEFDVDDETYQSMLVILQKIFANDDVLLVE